MGIFEKFKIGFKKSAENISSGFKEILLKKIPILGICYGLQLIAKIFGGKIKSSKKKENLEELPYIKKTLHF